MRPARITFNGRRGRRHTRRPDKHVKHRLRLKTKQFCGTVVDIVTFSYDESVADKSSGN